MAKKKQVSYEEALFKQALRDKLFNSSHIMRANLQRGTKFLLSDSYPTQVLNTSVGRFIRVNKSDVKAESIDDLLSTLMSLPHYAYKEGFETEFEEAKVSLINQAIKTSDEVDYTDIINNKNIVELDEFENIKEVKFNIAPQVIPATSTATVEKLDDGTTVLKENTDSIDTDGKDVDMSKDVEKLDSILGSIDGTSPSKSDKTEIKYEALADLEQSLKDMQSFPAKTKFYSPESVLTLEDLKKLYPKVKQLEKALKGSGSKDKRITPTKRLSSKDVATDKDKVYIRKNAPKGKHVKINLLIDMSGSMSGHPVKNAVRLVWLLNQLAKKGYVTMSVMYSETSRHYKINLPCSDTEILGLCRTGDSEGLAKTAKHYVNEIRGTNLLCITDGNIVDEPIDKSFWAKNKITSTGIYVNKSIKDYTEYSHSLSKWFNHAIVRRNLDDLIEWLIRAGLKG